MKILYVINQFYPEVHYGTAKFLFNLARALQRCGNDVKVVTWGSVTPLECTAREGRFLIKEFLFEGIPVIAFGPQEYSNISNHDILVHEIDELSEKILLQEKPDLLHIAHIMKNGSFAEAAAKLQIPHLLTLTDFYLMCPNLFLIDNKNRPCRLQHDCGRCTGTEISSQRDLLSQKILNNASRITAPSEYVKRVFEKRYEQITIDVVQHGIDLNRGKKNEKVYRSGDRLVFGFMGGCETHKGCHLLIPAIETLKGEANLKIYGAGDTQLVELILHNRQLPNVELCGVFDKEELGEIFSGIDVLLVPSIVPETFSLVVNEALASGVPVIASETGALPERVKNGHNGFTFENGNYRQLSDLLQLVVSNPEILNLLKSNISRSEIPSTADEARAYRDLYTICRDGSGNGRSSEESPTGSISGLDDLYFSSAGSPTPRLGEEEIEKLLARHGGVTRSIRQFECKIDFLRQKFAQKKIRYLIWGTGLSGRLTHEMVTALLPGFELVAFIDRFKGGSSFGTDAVYSPERLSDLSFDYIIIATNPGKQFAKEWLENFGLRALEDFIYGYAVK